MIRLIDVQQALEAQAVLEVQTPAYLMEAAIIDYDAIPALKDTVATIQGSDEIFYGLYEENTLCAVISFKQDSNVLDIHRLVVHPSHHKKGIAQALLLFVENNFAVEKIVVATGTKNIPAIKLYIKNGFTVINEKTIADGLSISFLEKML